ncbi:MAG: hypothetical protein GY711_07195 [bacterium]|nr:hypothetical protein [bacterium]
MLTVPMHAIAVGLGLSILPARPYRAPAGHGPSVHTQDTLIARWLFTAEQHADGTFLPVAGEWPLPRVEPRFVGEGAGQSLLLPLQPSLMAVEQPVEAAALPSDELSIEAWVALDTHLEWGGIFSAIEDNGGAETGVLLGTRGRFFTFAVSSQGTGDPDGLLTYLLSREAIQPGRWYHVVGTYDGKSQKIYVDGELSAESDVQTGAVLYSSTQTVAVCAYKDSNEDYRLSGAVHEVALHDRALSKRGIQRSYKKMAGKLPAPEAKTFNNIPKEEGTPLHQLQPAINQAITEGVEHLLREQHRDGSWTSHISGYRNGATGLAVYTLLKCGLPADHPSVVAGLEFMRAKPPKKTYEAACQLLAIGATGDTNNVAWAEEIVGLLLDWESGAEPGGWAYPGGRVDLSNTQFAALGFWGASQLGVNVPARDWQRMVAKTVQKHQSYVEEVDWPDDGGKGRRSGKRKIAGFSYYEDRGPFHESGTMTTAGLCVLGIPRMLLGKKLGARYLKMAAKSELLGMGWLETYYEDMWDEVGHGRQDQVSGIVGDDFYYYLYGVERVGAFFDTELIGGNPWYRDGAERLLEKRGADGSWSSEVSTCFALLFLRRASAPRQSGRAVDREDSVFADATGDVHIRATGTQRVTFWIAGFAPELLRQFEGEVRTWRGLRVVSVEYLADGASLSKVPGDPTQVWKLERYAAQHSFDLPGQHTLQARVTVIAADGRPEDSRYTKVFESAVLQITTRDSPRDWMAANLELAGADVPGPSTPEVSASSARQGHAPGLACDELLSTRWVCADADERPWIRFDLGRGVLAEELVLWQANSKLSMRGTWGSMRRVGVSINGRQPLEVDMGTDDLRGVRLEFAKPVRVRSLEITVLEFTRGSKGTGVGFSGVELRPRQR